jgi:arabinosyltransferase C
VHPIYLSKDVKDILSRLNQLPGRHVLIAPPGVPSQAFANHQQELVPLSELAPQVPDLNAIASGLTGVYTYAGHWSETPDYDKKRGRLSRIFFGNEPDDTKRARIALTGADLIIAPNPDAFPGIPDLSKFGTVIVEGPQFRLVQLRPTPGL